MLDAGPRGIPSPATIRDEFVEESLHRPGTGLLCLENTHNVRGGLAISPDAIEAAATAAHDLDVPVHLDGARVFNAAVALDVPVTEIVNHVDSVMFCLSKGLGAPIGSVLVGADTFIERARRVRKLFGGGMRQVGIIAAPGLHALDNVDDLETDHEHARILADALTSIDGFAVSSPETNIILVEVSETGLDAAAVCDRLQSQGVGASTVGATTVRFCTHRDVDRSDIDETIERISQVMS